MATDFSPEILDQILADGGLKPEDLTGEDGLLSKTATLLISRRSGMAKPSLTLSRLVF